MPAAIGVKIRVEGAREILAATDRLPPEAKDELRQRSAKLAEKLKTRIVAAANALGRQDALAARSVKVEPGLQPKISAGRIGGRKSQGVLFGSEFGANGRFGWYARPRYANSRGRQFRPHLGQGSYWFFRTVDESESEIKAEYTGAVQAVCDKWGAL